MSWRSKVRIRYARHIKREEELEVVACLLRCLIAIRLSAKFYTQQSKKHSRIRNTLRLPVIRAHVQRETINP